LLQMDEKTYYKLISSFLTTIISSTLISLFIYQSVAIRYKAKQKRATQDEIVVDLTMISNNQISKPKSKPKPQPQPQAKPQPKPQPQRNIVKDNKKIAPSHKINKPKQKAILYKKSIGSLFDDVNITFDKQRILKNVQNEIKIFQTIRTKPKKIVFDKISDKKIFQKRKSNARIVFKNNRKDVSIKSADLQETKGIEDEYFNKIYKIFSDGWNPSIIYKNMYVSVVIEINKNGNFDFYIKNSNANSAFINDLKSYLLQISSKKLPPPQKKLTVEINFIAKE